MKLYGPLVLRRRALIAHFCWCVTSLSSYVLALNADNFKANKHFYIGMTGSVDAVAYICSMLLLKKVGRKISSCCLFFWAGSCLLIVLSIPSNFYALYLTNIIIFQFLFKLQKVAVYWLFLQC